MKSFFSHLTWVVLTLMVFGSLLIATSQHAEAKRFGMGSSFGKSLNKPATAPRSSLDQKATVGKQASGARTAARGGLAGMLGGLALGGLLGAIFFGGAFEGINFFDVLVIGGIVILLVLIFNRRRTPARQYAFAGPRHPDAFVQHDTGPASQHAGMTAGSGHVVRPEIDESYFIPAAKDIFARMQSSWDQKNLDDIRSFCTPEVAKRVEADMQTLGDHQTRTEVSLLDAELVDSWIEGDDALAAVRFHALLNEETLDAAGQSLEKTSQNVDEIWVFRRPQHSDDPTWFLAGIQQG